jgi:hypothetical protein
MRNEKSFVYGRINIKLSDALLTQQRQGKRPQSEHATHAGRRHPAQYLLVALDLINLPNGADPDGIVYSPMPLSVLAS